MTTEKNLPQQPASVISMLFIPNVPRPAMRATCLWDQALYVPSTMTPASTGTAAEKPIARIWDAMRSLISAAMSLVTR